MLDSVNDLGLQSGYQVDAENAAEMARLMKQARMLSEHFGLFPEGLNLSQKRSILDIGCGPGEWVFAIAQRFPGSQVTGIDISEQMTEYARYNAVEHEITNARFLVMDARQPLVFDDASLNFIHARFITGFLSVNGWPLLLKECFRLLRVGGSICSTEFDDLGITTSPSLTKYAHLLLQAARRAGQCFTDEGDHYGITAVQGRLLQDAGFQNIQSQAFALNFSVGMPAHKAMYDNFRTFLKLVQPFLIRQGVVTQRDIDTLYARTMREMQDHSFCAVAFFQRVWADKPACDKE